MGPDEQPSRLGWIDTARGIGIVLVVLGHTISGVAAVGLVSDEGGLRSLYDAIYTFHMPLFFMLAGETFEARPGVVRRRAEVLLYPYLVWSLLQGSLAVVLPWAVNAHLTPATLAVRIVTNPIGQFWFLPVLFVMSVLAAVAKGRVTWVAAGVFLLAFVPPVFDHIGLVGRAVCRYMPFFALGMTRWRPRSRWWALGLLSVWLCRAWQPSTVWFAVPALGGIFATIVVSDVLDGPVLRQLGRWSLVIFVAHVLVAAAARAVLLRLGLRDGTLHVALGTMAGVGGASILAWLRDRGYGEALFTPPFVPRRRVLRETAAPSLTQAS